MSRQEVSPRWHASPYTGLFSRHGPVPRRPADPAVYLWSGTLPRWGPGTEDLVVGGAGWDPALAEAAGVGEAMERWRCRVLERDGLVEASFDAWQLDEPAVPPERWVLFHPEQHAHPGFPFRPLKRSTVCRWVRCRVAGSGEACWAPEGLVFLQSDAPFTPGLSTGLACGRAADPVLLRGLQEVIERDALIGAWWGRYPLTEHAMNEVFSLLDPVLPARLRRPHLRYRCCRIATPWSAHVTVATIEGEDREGYLFAAGSACRETRAASWAKSLLEAVQGWHHVRHLKPVLAGHVQVGSPADFAEHAVYYSLHPEQLRKTVLGCPGGVVGDPDAQRIEGWPVLAERLGPHRPVLFRIVTPPGLSAAGVDRVVLRVLVPGLQPLHGHHGYPFLGGPLWAPRGLAEWGELPPHPFP
jgi:ribosomal protein S12 methylthiotransferase accessory factor